jgi:peptidoglycan biosynthesis protein MviN/MurJ (putative lipid II flippase)
VPFRQALGLLLLGQVVMNLSILVDQYFAAGLAEGAISSIGYANRILAMVLGIVATALTRATLPVFSRSGAGAGAQARSLANRWAALMIGAGLMVAMAGWILAPWGVRLLFQRGTFTSGDSAVVTHLLRLGLLQLPFYFSSLVLVSLQSSLGRYGLIMATGVLGLGVKVAGNFLLLPVLGTGALMLSTTLVYGVNLAVLARAGRE